MQDTPERDMKFALPIALILNSLLLLMFLWLTGCAALVPNYVAPEFEHISHATPHEPITDHPTDFGANLANVVIGYNLPRHFNLELADGISLDHHYPANAYEAPSYGEIEGPREEFTARLRYMIQVRP